LSIISFSTVSELGHKDHRILPLLKKTSQDSKDIKAWIELGEILIDNSYIREAITCFNNATEIIQTI